MYWLSPLPMPSIDRLSKAGPSCNQWASSSLSSQCKSQNNAFSWSPKFIDFKEAVSAGTKISYNNDCISANSRVNDKKNTVLAGSLGESLILHLLHILTGPLAVPIVLHPQGVCNLPVSKVVVVVKKQALRKCALSMLPLTPCLTPYGPMVSFSW